MSSAEPIVSSRPMALALLVGLAFGCAPRPPSHEAAPTFRNLVVVMVDTLRRDHLASYGYGRETAPFLSTLAREGVQVDAVSASSWTKPSIATLITGVYPQRHGAVSRTAVLPPALPTLAEILHDHGYSTAGYTPNRFAGAEFGFDRGHETWVGGFDSFADLSPEPYRNPASPTKATGRWVTANGLALAATLTPPFYLYVHYLDPHDPYTPERVWGVEPDERREPPPAIQPDALDVVGLNPASPEIRRLVDEYDGTILDTDRAIHDLVDGLAAAGLLEGTLVAVTADHGEEFLERGNLTHGKTLHAESVDVPLILWSPTGLPAARPRWVFHQVHFLATVLQALGLEPPEGLDGTGLWSDLLRDGEGPTGASLLHLDLAGKGALGILDAPLKLIHQSPSRAGNGSLPPTTLLYDETSDPGETSPLAREAEAGRLLDELVRRHNELSGRAAPGGDTPIEGDLRRHLADLGYVTNGEEPLATIPRAVPATLRPVEPRTWGLFAGADPARLGTRVDLTLEPDGPELVRGWPPPAPEGRPSAPRAVVVLRRPERAARLCLNGIQPGEDRASIVEVAVDGAEPVRFELRPGEFERCVRLPDRRARGGVVFVDLDVLSRRRGTHVPRAPVPLWRRIELR